MHSARVSRLVLPTLLAIATTVVAQDDNPHIGYVYPAGGQQGTTFEVLLGGQNLDGAFMARISGDGVTATVGEHIRPLNQGQFKEMQNRMGELQKKKEAAGAGGSRRRGRRTEPQEPTGQWTVEDEAMLTEIRRRLATFSIRRSSVPALVETVTLQVTISADAPPGWRELRMQTENGLTNPVVFCVGQLPEQVEKSGRDVAVDESQNRGGRGRKRQSAARPAPGTSPTSNEPETETDITLPAMLNGQILPGDVDRYRFEARQGQHLVVDVSARKLIPYLSDAVPGWFQATVALLDAEGREVVFDDDFRFHPDPVLHCEIPEDGSYVVEIRDSLYRGREDFVYRVAVGELPYVTHVFPPGSQAGEETTFSLIGWNLAQMEFTCTTAEPGMHLVASGKDGVASNPVPISVDTMPEHLEAEPNNSLDDAQQVSMPTIVNGRIGRAGDIDVFRIDCRAGTEIVAEVYARRLDSPLDSIIKLTDADGKLVAMNDDYEDKTAGLITHHADSRLSARIPRSGHYYLYLGDGQQQGGDAYAYRLHLGPLRPDFELRVVPSSVNARAGTTVPITVHAMRNDGFDGDIVLGLHESPPGFILSGGRIPAGCDIVRATLTVPSEATSPISLSLAGQAIIQRRTVTRVAGPADDMMQAFIYRHLVPAEDFQVAVTGAARGSSTMGVLATRPVRIPVGGMVKVPVIIPTRSFFGEIQLELDNPPAGLSIDSVAWSGPGSVIVFRSKADEVERGLKGNLIVNVFAEKGGEDSGKGKEQRKKRRILLSALPAIPFEISER